VNIGATSALLGQIWTARPVQSFMKKLSRAQRLLRSASPLRARLDVNLIHVNPENDLMTLTIPRHENAAQPTRKKARRPQKGKRVEPLGEQDAWKTAILPAEIAGSRLRRERTTSSAGNFVHRSCL